ncbi:hypothetical protein CWO91_24645 [Bradyrhizobium genosp. SA-3]|nr:hypothetical protein CWO91_24645 [Bradyrhizobium genosp. SA-3]
MGDVGEVQKDAMPSITAASATTADGQRTGFGLARKGATVDMRGPAYTEPSMDGTEQVSRQIDARRKAKPTG